MKRASEAEPIRPNLACSYPDTGTSVLLKKARQLLRGDNRESSASSSCSVNSPLCEKVERNRTGISTSSASETDALLLEMTLGGNKELWEMHWLGHKEKMMKGSGDDKTANDQIILPRATYCSVNSPLPVEIDDDKHRNKELEITDARKLQMEVQKRLRERLEAQRQLQLKLQERLLQLKLQERLQFLQKLNEN
ncbi:uncharacterized protein [Coffea arabica]|uniref:MYB-CC type transcription factor LHEQLE-containing domain-containing protein n=1 Tax=Coffea arabica TaxID=13443 RepID=A0A6P6VFF2_COFAR|nr:uncharacterized protein LOC113722643 [Coffea arabica]